jgi:hypothetical protein
VNLPKKEEQKLKISSPEKISRLLEKAGQSELPLLIRTLSDPKIAVRAQAKPSSRALDLEGFKVCSISARGLDHLVKKGKGGVQLEFPLSSLYMTFYSSISDLSVEECTFTIPNYIVSMERRKNTRFLVVGTHRAFVSIEGWEPSVDDSGVRPIFLASKETARLVSVGDISLSGLLLVERFPAICSVLDEIHSNHGATLYIPMMKPIAASVNVRWHRKTKEVITDLDGRSRFVTTYRYGVQFRDPTDELLSGIRGFIHMIAQAEAI